MQIAQIYRYIYIDMDIDISSVDDTKLVIISDPQAYNYSGDN